MIVYEATKRKFLDQVHSQNIEDIVLEQFVRRTGRRVSKEEIRAWASSLGYMAKVLNDAVVPEDCGVAIEYSIPQTSKRVDFLLTGKRDDGTPCVVVVELKQWDSAESTDKDAVVRTRFSRGMAETSHPSYQAWSYAALLTGFNEAVHGGGIRIEPCVYLHNFPSHGRPLNDAFYAAHVARAPIFLGGDQGRAKLRAFIAEHVRRGDNGDALYKIEHGKIRPSRSLADALVGMLERADGFVLIDDQKLVYEQALRLAHKAQGGRKHVLIIQGGPGTGKSVVAVNLLVALIDAGMTAKYVTKNAAPRAVFAARLQGHPRKTEFSHLFVGSGAFTETSQDAFGALVVDEAHRLNEKSGLYANLGENQVMELIRAGRLTVFFIDESQKVTLKDIGTKDTIRHWAAQAGAVVHEMELASQFRCNGSDGYLAWLDHTLQVRETANPMLDPAEFDFQVVDSPNELRELIEARNRERNRARMVAGYCWPWPSKNDPAAYDIVMPEHGFQARWNLTTDGSLWMVSPTSVNEIGCIHTCQGLEVDYIGVIVGDDLVVRDGQVVTVPGARARSDKSIHGLKKLARDDAVRAREAADEIIKNTYRTLMTRGMKGCYVYCTDAETAAYFRSRLSTRAQVSLTTQVHSVAQGRVDEAMQVEAANSTPFRLLSREEVVPFVTAMPVISLKIAAGSFAASYGADSFDHWAAPEGFRIGPGMFIAQVVGESMNRKVPSGAWCVFRANPGGTRQGKIVIAEHRDIADPDTGGSYTLKQYSSEKVADVDGGWRHERITLSPLSSDPGYQPIVLTPEQAGRLTIVAELVGVLV